MPAILRLVLQQYTGKLALGLVAVTATFLFTFFAAGHRGRSGEVVIYDCSINPYETSLVDAVIREYSTRGEHPKVHSGRDMLEGRDNYRGHPWETAIAVGSGFRFARGVRSNCRWRNGLHIYTTGDRREGVSAPKSSRNWISVGVYLDDVYASEWALSKLSLDKNDRVAMIVGRDIDVGNLSNLIATRLARRGWKISRHYLGSNAAATLSSEVVLDLCAPTDIWLEGYRRDGHSMIPWKVVPNEAGLARQIIDLSTSASSMRTFLAAGDTVLRAEQFRFSN